MIQRYRVIELTPSRIDAAAITARKHGLRAYDAVQLSVALEVNRLHQIAGLDSVTLISADKELNSAAAVDGLAVDDPNAHP